MKKEKMPFGSNHLFRDEFESFNITRFEFDLDSFSEYLEITESLIEEKLREYISIREESADIDIYIKSQTLQLHYSSIIISLYSFLEQTMLELCSLAEKSNNIKIKDISGKGIFQFKTYLEKVIHIDFSSINNEWKEISQFNQLRNHFVHSSNSLIDKFVTKKRKNSIMEIQGLKFNNHSENTIIEFENDIAIKNFIATILSFISKIYFVEK